MYYLIVILKLVQSMLWYDKVLLVTFLSCTCIVWVNKPNAGCFFSLYFVLICTFYNTFGTLKKCAEICFNRTYLILLYAFKVMYSKISLVNHTDICFIFPDSMIIYMFLLIRNEIHCSIEVDIPVLWHIIGLFWHKSTSRALDLQIISLSNIVKSWTNSKRG